MRIFTENGKEFQSFADCVEAVAADIAGYAGEEDMNGLKKLTANFKRKTEDFYRENRKLNIGVVGQVKAGKSSFLNTLLFDGQDILPKASTPKTATLTRMEYSEENLIQVEYYSVEEWEILEDNAAVDLEDEIYTSAREITEMVKRSGVNPLPYLEKGYEKVAFASYGDLIASLNDYVGEDGRFTPIVKAVTLYLNKEEFKGLSIVDTPGLNDPVASRTIRTKEFMELCDVVFFLSQSSYFLDKNDWVLLSSQLPQKGVKRLVLIASKYDSGVRSILKKAQDEDEIFGKDENEADNIPEACNIVKKKLTKHAKEKVEEFVKDLEARESSKELIEVVRQCARPLMVSSLIQNMAGKEMSKYTEEERNVYDALKQFSKDMESDLKLLGGFEEVKMLFAEAVRQKEQIFQEKAKSFLPNAMEELRNLLSAYLEKVNMRVRVLEGNDREQLLEQKKLAENRINGVRADISAIFGDLNARLETERAAAVRDIRTAAKYLTIKDRTGTKPVYKTHTVSDSKWYNPFTWGKKHKEHYTYEKHYTYCIAADAIDNLKKYALESSELIERVFGEVLQLKAMKRNLLNVVIRHFDLGNENYDSSLFRIMVEETVSRIEFPVFHVEISDAVDGIAGRFRGELTSAREKTELSAALSKAVSRIYKELCDKLDTQVKTFKEEMTVIARTVEDKLLQNIRQEFDSLLSQCTNKEKEITNYREYAAALEKSLTRVK